MKIGLLDSGVGGITVLKEVMSKYPKHEYLYYADTNRAPYGEKTEDAITSYCKEAIDFLKEQGAELIIFACNTATKVALTPLKKQYPNLPLIGIEPPLEFVLERLVGHEKVALFATPMTVKQISLSPIYSQQPDRITLCPSVDLVRFAEQGEFSKDVIEPYLKTTFSSIFTERNTPNQEYQYVILGCTHFPFFKPSFKRLFPNQTILDGTFLILKQLETLLDEHEQTSPSPSLYFFKNKQLVPHSTFKEWIECY